MDIHVSYGTSVGSAPAAFKGAVKDVERFFENRYSDPITVNIRVEYKAIGGLGQSSFSLGSVSYSQMVAAMTANAKTDDDLSAVGSLPAVDPVGGSHHYYLSTALEKALGLRAANGTALDGTATFTSRVGFDYDRSDGIASNKYDFFGTVAHEFSEIMGRFLLTGGTQGGPPGGYSSLDLFHFAGANDRTFSGTTPGYFSIDNGRTHLLDFNTNKGGDFGDWAASAARDSFLAVSFNGVVNKVSETDLREMDILGYDRTGTAVAATSDGALAHLAVDHTGAAGYHLADEWMVAGHQPGIPVSEFA